MSRSIERAPRRLARILAVGVVGTTAGVIFDTSGPRNDSQALQKDSKPVVRNVSISPSLISQFPDARIPQTEVDNLKDKREIVAPYSIGGVELGDIGTPDGYKAALSDNASQLLTRAVVEALGYQSASPADETPHNEAQFNTFNQVLLKNNGVVEIAIPQASTEKFEVLDDGIKIPLSKPNKIKGYQDQDYVRLEQLDGLTPITYDVQKVDLNKPILVDLAKNPDDLPPSGSRILPYENNDLSKWFSFGVDPKTKQLIMRISTGSQYYTGSPADLSRDILQMLNYISHARQATDSVQSVQIPRRIFGLFGTYYYAHPWSNVAEYLVPEPLPPLAPKIQDLEGLPAEQVATNPPGSIVHFVQR